MCFGCGPAHPDGLRLQSRRIPGGGLGLLEARVRFPRRYCAFPDIVNGGIISTVMDCHGNWAAAIALMDKHCLPRPPLTLTAAMSVTYREPTPPDTELLLRSRVLSMRASASGAPHKATIEVEVLLLQPAPADDAEGGAGAGAAKSGRAGEEKPVAGVAPGERVLASGTGTYKRMGALRSL